MQHLEVSCAVQHLFKSLGFKGLILVPMLHESNFIIMVLNNSHVHNSSCYYIK